ncbi:hypothetical protein GCM10027169_15420 [Gordonia jinhuaensis]|uniref:PucR C-terminal helix-turn-helix domain-containing protein n=1 Tax=Gordonia jinhuaensis TaxID=1517702 RepID=A0A916WUX7_9ACTN|nr:hypothetical protein GCM10011489_23460 [Gordonia jinhuaensis]
MISLLATDIESTRSWVADTLGALAEDTPAAGVLRSTLSSFFANGQSHLHTATKLNLHRNTVRYRVDKALAEVPGHRDHLDLALALRVCELLGPTILAPE